MRAVDVSRVVHLAGILALVVYVSSYVAWSRISTRRGQELGITGFYFFFPDTPRSKLLNRFFVAFYYPLILVDEFLGTGAGRAYEPRAPVACESHISPLGAAA